MNPILRRIAVSGAAAVALVGGAATVTTADAAEHEATVVAIAQTDSQPGSADGITNDLAPNGGAGAPLQNPGTVPAGYPEQIQTQASGGAIGAGVVAILVLGIIVFVRVKHRDIKPGDAVLVGLFGIALSGTVIGAMGEQLTDSVVSSLGNVLGGL
jgi:hypothetical protein